MPRLPTAFLCSFCYLLILAGCGKHRSSSNQEEEKPEKNAPPIVKHFVNYGPKEQVEVTLNIRETINYAYGVYSEVPYDDPNARRDDQFNGTIKGEEIEVRFTSSDVPYPRTPEKFETGSSTDTWRLTKTDDGKDVLEIMVYGRNHETNQFEESVLKLDPNRNKVGSGG